MIKRYLNVNFNGFKGEQDRLQIYHFPQAAQLLANGDNEILVHSSGLMDNIPENDSVSYDIEQGKKSLNAINVKIS